MYCIFAKLTNSNVLGKLSIRDSNNSEIGNCYWWIWQKYNTRGVGSFEKLEGGQALRGTFRKKGHLKIIFGDLPPPAGLCLRAVSNPKEVGTARLRTKAPNISVARTRVQKEMPAMASC